MRTTELQVDVTEAAGLGEPAHIALTVTAPRDVPTDPVVCFAKPGAGYSRGYFTEDLPGPGTGSGSQAAWHADRGWVFVALDHLGVGESSLHDSDRLSFVPIVAAAQAAEAEVRQKLAAGTLIDGLGPVRNPVTVGIGQSMGGAFTIVQQGRHHCYDGVGVLGFSPLHTLPPTRPGTPPLALPWVSARHPAVRGDLHQRAGTGRSRRRRECAGTERRQRHGVGFPLRRRGPGAWCSGTWTTTPPGTATSLHGRRRPSRVPLSCGAWPPDPSWPRPRPSGALSWSRWVSGTWSSTPAASCAPSLRRRASTSSHARAWRICTTSPGTRELFWQRIETWADWVRAIRNCAALTR